MRTFARRISKRNVSEPNGVEVSLRWDIRAFLLRDVLPTLIMLIILIICSSAVAEKIERAKISRAVGVLETGPRQ